MILFLLIFWLLLILPWHPCPHSHQVGGKRHHIIHFPAISTQHLISGYTYSEWIAAIISKGGKASKDFLGTQGDIWDAQWDMALTLIGSILVLFTLSKLHDKLLRKDKNHAEKTEIK
jgi:uncharacterized membrane protein YjdF